MQRAVGRTLVMLSLAAVGASPSGVGAQRPAAAPAAQAPAPRPLRFGEAVTGTLVATDPKLSGSGAFHTYRFTARPDKRYVITMDAAGFDALVSVLRPVGGITEVVASDDDSGGDAQGGQGTNARLRFRTSEAGTYLIVAQSFSEDALGAYTLRVEETDPPMPAAPVAIRVGQTVEGRFDAGSPVDDAEGYPYASYSVLGGGQRVRIVMRSEDFDAFLAVRPAASEPCADDLLTDDDGAGGTDARVTLTLDGAYVITARPLGNSATGTYTLSVEEVEPVAVVQRPIAAGQTVEGELTDGDPELDAGGFFHEYVLQAAAGDEFRITLRSEEFDAFLRWGTKAGDAFTEVASDDDGGGDLDSQLIVRVTAGGRYVIRVSALEGGSVGPYSLSVERVGR
jgi:hypothetical protein